MGLILYGKITKRHGLSGDLKVLPFSKDLSSFKNLKKVYIELNPDEDPVEYSILNKRFHKNFAIVRFKDVNTVKDSDALVNCNLLIDETQLEELNENEFYWFQLIGLEVFTDKNVYVGKVTDLINNGAQEILIVNNGKDEVLIPFVEKFIVETNILNSRIIINPVDGLLE